MLVEQRFQNTYKLLKILATLLMFLLIVLQVKLWQGAGGRVEVVQLEQAVSLQSEINEEAQQRNSVLVAEIEDLNSGLTAVEERARSDLGMIKEGETFFQIIQDPSVVQTE